MNKMLMKSTTYDERLRSNWEWCQAYFNRKTEQFKIYDWKLKLNRAKTSIGVTNYATKYVGISAHFLRGPSCGERDMRDAILHELAHVIAGSKAKHGEEWKRIAEKIGCSANVRGNMDMPHANYLVECEFKCQSVTYFKVPNVSNKLCGKCRKGKLLVKSLN